MIKKLKILFLLIFVLFGLAGCPQTQPTTKYSFKDITNHEIIDIENVLINYGAMASASFQFEGDYEDIFDVEYILSDMPYNETKNIMENYRFHLFIDFNLNDSSYSDIEMFVYEYKIYCFSNDSLYESFKKVDYNKFYTTVPPIQTINLFVMYDYGSHISDKAITLLNGNLIWFDPADYGIDKLVAGDELIIKYTGEYIAQTMYPGKVDSSKMHIQSIDVIEADIAEFRVSAIPGSDDLDLVPVDSKYNEYSLLNNEGYVVSIDGFFKKYDQYEEGTILYGSLPKSTNSIRVDGLYDYNPREKIIPTGQFEVTIIDQGNNIIDELSHDAGMYTPGMILEFYSHPIMDVDLAMYVNDVFYQIQDIIEVNEEYMWKYSFVMPAKNVVIEFKTINIEYVHVRDVLNIPAFSINDIVEVRYEQGYIGVAPGSLTNIKYSTNYEDKNMLLSLLEMTVYEDTTTNWQVTGGSYTLYSIFTNEKRYDIKITNGYISINKKYYRFLGKYITFKYPSIEVNSYITYLDTFKAYTLDGVKLGDFEGLSEFEFVSYDGTITEVEDYGYLDTEFGRIYVHDNRIFYTKDGNVHTYYNIVGDKTFDDIFLTKIGL